MSTQTSIGKPAEIVPEASARTAELKPLSMRSNFTWTIFGSGIYGVCQWGMLIALAKLGSAEMVGRFALGLAICAPVVMFTNMQLRNVQATDAKGEYQLSDYLTLRLWSSTLALVVIGVITLIAQYRFEVTAVVIIIALAKVVESISDALFGFLQKHERLDLVSLSMMVKGPASLAALAALIYWTNNVLWGAAGMLLVWSTILLTYDLSNVRRLQKTLGESKSLEWSRILRPKQLATARRLAWLSLPLGIVGLLDSLNVNVPRYIIERVLGEAALGHFAAMAYVIVAGNMIVAALAHSAAPRLSQTYTRDIEEFKSLVWKLVQFGSVLGLAGVLIALFWGRQFLTLLYTAEYAVHAQVFVWLMLAAAFGFLARFLVCSMTAARCFKAQAPLYAIALLVLAALSVWLVPQAGLLGAAYSICLGMAVLFLGTVGINIRAVRVPVGDNSASVAASPAASTPYEGIK